MSFRRSDSLILPPNIAGYFGGSVILPISQMGERRNRIENGRTIVPLQFEPYGSVFVVFRKVAAQPSRTVPQFVDTPVCEISGAWEVHFQADRGAPPSLSFDHLASWSDNSDAGIKYFSGSAIYSKKIDAPAGLSTGDRLWLDLGDVKNLAEVSVNGKSLGIVWKVPFRIDVTGAMKPGSNVVEVKVTNLWVNRLIGDQQPDAAKKYTYTTQSFYQADSPLLPSGLLGPVQLVKSVKQ